MRTSIILRRLSGTIYTANSTIHINDDGSVDADGNIVIFLPHIPVKFNIVTGNFRVSSITTSLINSPRFVGGNFWCSFSDITTLEGCPIEVGGDFTASGCHQLTDIKHMPREIGGMVRFVGCSNIDYINRAPEYPIVIHGYGIYPKIGAVGVTYHQGGIAHIGNLTVKMTRYDQYSR